MPKLSGQLSGTYTIGGTSPDFSTIDSALRTAKYQGVKGPVTFLLRSGYYNEKLNFDSIKGLTSLNTLSLISDPKNTTSPQVSYKASGVKDNSVIFLRNVSYITISGISFFSIDTNFSRIVEIRGNVNYLNLLNDSFISKNIYNYTNNSFTDKATIYSYGGTNPMLTVKNCVLKNNMVGISLHYCPKSNIIANTIINTAVIGILAEYCDSTLIESNKIESNKSLQSFNLIGIDVEYNNYKVLKNKITLNSDRPFQLGIVNFSTKNCLFANNSITVIDKSKSSVANCIRLQWEVDTTFVYHNSLFVSEGDSSNNPALEVVYYNSNPTGSHIITNNNFMNYGKGYNMKFGAYANGKLKTQNNNLYTNGSKIISYNSNNTEIKYANLNDWRKKFPNDTNSIAINPKVINPLDLNVKNMRLKWKGLPIKIIRTDLNGIKRDSLKPDIGAFVISPAKNDLELSEIFLGSLPQQCGIDSSNISAIIFNNGGDTQTNFKIYSKITSTKGQNYYLTTTYTKKIAPGTSDTFKLSKFSTFKGGYFTFKIFLSSVADNDLTNDTLNTTSWFIGASPVAPKSKNDTICDNLVVPLTTTAPPNSILKWYSSKFGNSFILLSDTLTIKNMKHDTAFYVSSMYQHGIPSSILTTKLRGNNATGGIMFNLTPKKDIILDSFSSIFNSYGNKKDIIVYFKHGSCSGYETKPSKWLFCDSAVANPSDDSLEYMFRLKKTIRLEKDSVYAIYLNFDAKVTSGSFTKNNSDLSFSNGSGLSSPFGGTVANSIFNGHIYYNIPFYCESDRVKYQIKITNTKKLFIGRDTAYCSNTGINYPLSSNLKNTKYRWSNGDTTKSIFAKSGGIYILTIIDSNKCEIKDSAIITKNINPIVNLGSDINYCQSKGINVTLNPGSNYASYLWSNGNKSKNLNIKLPGIYSVVVTDIKGCTGVDTIIVNKIVDPVINLGNDTFYCNHDGLQLKLDAGKGYKYYRWSNLDTLSYIIASTKGKYLVEVEDIYGCKGKDSLVINEKTSPVVKLRNDTTFCRNNGINFTLDAGAGFADYLWSNADKSRMILITAKGSYSVTVSALNGCLARDTFLVIEDAPLVNFGKDTGYCKGNSFSLNLDAGATFKTYKWSTTATTPKINIQTKGIFSVTVTDSLGCQGADTIKVSEIIASVNLGKDTSFCANSQFNKTLDAGAGNVAYKWMNGEKTQTLQAKIAGIYSVIVTAPFGCVAKDTIKVTGLINPVVNLGSDRVLNPFLPVNEILDAGAGFVKYQWNTSETSQTIGVSSIGSYSVVVYGNNGCTGSDTILVRYWNPVNVQSTFHEGVKIYPNPANDFVTLTSLNFEIENIEVYTTTGKKIYQTGMNHRNIIINTSDWSNGVYLIKYTINKTNMQIKFIINH